MSSLAAAGMDKKVTASTINEAKAMNNMDGEEAEGDTIIFGTIHDALLAVKIMIPSKNDVAYEFRSVHLGKSAAKGKTIDDIICGFLYWSQKQEDVENECFNVTKAFKRLKVFAEYQEELFDKYFKSPVYLKEARLVADFLSLVIPEYDIAGGSPLWLMNLNSHGRGWDMKEWKITNELLMRGWWYYIVRSLFDKKTQHPGIIFVQAFNGMSMQEMMRCNSCFSGIETEMQKLFYGCLPIKMKSCILVGSPWWLSVVLGIMRMFLSKKMSERLKNVSVEKMHQLIGGKTMLPKGVLGGVTAMTERYPQADSQEDEDKKLDEEAAEDEVLL
jgi:hypothetical protein